MLGARVNSSSQLDKPRKRPGTSVEAAIGDPRASSWGAYARGEHPFSKYQEENLVVKHAIIANTAVAMNIDNATIFRPASAHQARPRGYDKYRFCRFTKAIVEILRQIPAHS